MQLSRFLGIKALSFAGLLCLAAAAQAADPVRIGYSMSLTGIFAQAAPSQVNGYELWKEQVNAQGGLDVAGVKRMMEFVSYDDQSNPANAVRIYEKLITQDKVDLLIAPWGTSMHIAIAPVLSRYKFPMVGNTAASVSLRDIGPGYIWFPASEIPDRFGAQLAEFMHGQGIKKAPADAPKIVEAMIAHPAVRRINFTGSTKVGRIIARLAAEHLKSVLLELGGKAPLVVLDDADLDQAVDAAAFGAFMNQGQICMSTERVIAMTRLPTPLEKRNPKFKGA